MLKPSGHKDFEKLFLEFFSPLTVFAWQKVRDRMTAEDIVHDVFADIYENLESMTAEKLNGPYLYRAVHNRCLNEIKHQGVVARNQAAASESLHHEPLDPFEEVKQIEFEYRYNTSLEKLPPACRKIFEMSREQGMKNAAIAAELKISKRTVETQISKAIRILRKHLAKYMVIAFLLSSNFIAKGVRANNPDGVMDLDDPAIENRFTVHEKR